MEQSGWSLWTGPEVEGRLVGLRTLFVRDLLPGVATKWCDFDHVWLCKEFVQRHGYALAEQMLADGVLVSIELTPDMLKGVPSSVQQAAHLVLAVAAPDFGGLLKPTDTVRLDVAPFDVFTVTVGQLQHTTPAHYRRDERIA